MSETATVIQLESELVSSADRHRNAPSLLWLFLAQALVWTLAAWLSRGNLDTQGDMVENYVWGVEWQAGYAKHPPLFAWITAAWFKVFPHWDIAYFGLSAFNAMLGLLGIVALAGRFLPRQLAFAAGLAMAVSPLYSNLAIKFNANSVLLSVWPWAAYWFVRFMQTGTWRSALAFGALAGAAILGKYFSVVLLLAFLVAAFARPAWRARLLDWRTLIAAGAFLAVLAPHVHWLVTNHFPTFGYAKERTGGTLVDAAVRLGVYTLAQAGYLLLSFGFVVFLVRDRRGEAARLMLKSLVRPSLCPDLWWLTLAPLFAVAFVALAAKTQMASVWGMAQWFAIVPMWLVVLKTNQFDLAPRRSVNLLIGYWLLVLVATPAVGYIGALRNSDDAAEPRKELAAYAQTVWAQQHGAESIPVVMGSVHEAESIAFYSSGHTHYWDIVEPHLTPWLSRQDAIRQGAVLVCRPDDAHCRAACAALAGVQPVSVDIRKHAWNRMLPSRRYVLYFMPPR